MWRRIWLDAWRAAVAAWRRFADENGIDPLEPPAPAVRRYLKDRYEAGAKVSTLKLAVAVLRKVQTLAGHASTDTTARYDRRGEKAVRKTAQMIHVPYIPPPGIGWLGRRERPQPAAQLRLSHPGRPKRAQ